MQPLALTRPKRREYEDVLKSAVRVVRIRATLLTHSQRGTGTSFDIIEWSLDGQNTDPSQPMYVANLTVANPRRKIRVKRKGLWFSHKIRIHYGVWLPQSEEWFDVAVFTGPVTDTENDPNAGTLAITCEGKESEHLAPYLFANPVNTPKGSRGHKIIRRILRERGESGRFRFPQKSRRLNKPRGWPANDPEVQPWLVMDHIADTLDRRLFYRGNGDPVLERERKAPVWKFRPGRDSVLIQRPTQRHSIRETYNRVLVKGGHTKSTTDGKNKRVIGKRELRDQHPLSKETLTGGKRPRVLVVERDKLNQPDRLKQKAKELSKRRGGHLEQEVAIRTLPIPHLELGDNVIAADQGFRKKFEMKRFHMTTDYMDLDYEGAPPVRRAL